MEILHWKMGGDGPLDEAMRRRLEDCGYRVTCYRYPPGTFFDTHTHDVDKMDGVLEGRLQIDMGAESVVLEPGDVVVIPRGEPHRASVVGEQTVVSLDGVRSA